MIVVDTNIISYFYLTSEYSKLAEQLYIKESTWSAPLLWRSELRNVLTLYIRKELFTLNDAAEIFEAAEDLLINNEFEINSIHVLTIAQASGCPAYDCEFVSLAQDLNVQLVTMDKKILDNFSDTALSIPEFLKKI